MCMYTKWYLLDCNIFRKHKGYQYSLKETNQKLSRDMQTLIRVINCINLYWKCIELPYTWQILLFYKNNSGGDLTLKTCFVFEMMLLVLLFTLHNWCCILTLCICILSCIIIFSNAHILVWHKMRGWWWECTSPPKIKILNQICTQDNNIYNARQNAPKILFSLRSPICTCMAQLSVLSTEPLSYRRT